MEFVVDTNVYRYLALRPQSINVSYYEANWPTGGTLLSQVVAEEIAQGEFSDLQRRRLDALLSRCKRTPFIDRTSEWFARARVVRDTLGLTDGVGDNDLLIIGQAAQNGWGYMSHDKSAVRVARGLNVPVLTAHEDMELYFALDERRLAMRTSD